MVAPGKPGAFKNLSMEAFKEGCWAYIEIMGHNKIAGFAREIEVAGKGFIQIEVPSVIKIRRESQIEIPGFEKIISPDSIFAITRCTEEVARKIATTLSEIPVPEWAGTQTTSLPMAEYEDFDDD